MATPDRTFPIRAEFARALGIDPDRITLVLTGERFDERIGWRVDGAAPTPEQVARVNEAARAAWEAALAAP